LAAELSDIAAQLAVEEATVTGVTKAFSLSDIPNKLVSGFLPCFINVPGPATYEAYGGHNVMERRTWRLMLYVCPIAVPSDVATKAQVVEPFFRDVVAVFAGAQQLSGESGVEFTWIGSDDGLDVLEYAGDLFAGIEFQMEAVTTFAATMES
jgi:hypothetical protein